MTILEAISIYLYPTSTFYRVTCDICDSYFELSLTNYTKLEVAHILIELGWQVVDDNVLCPTCNKELKRG